MKKIVCSLLFGIMIFIANCYIVSATEDIKMQECRNQCTEKCANDSNPSECYRGCQMDNCTEKNTNNQNSNTYAKIQCGELTLPKKIAQLVNTGINLIKIAVPILLVIVGSLDFMKAVTAQKEDEINKAKNMFVKRLISGIMVFLVIFIVQLVIGLVAPHNTNDSMWDCVDCFINGDC